MNDKFDLKKIDIELEKRSSISEKLDYWLEIKNKYKDELENYKHTPLKKKENEAEIIEILNFGKDYTMSPLLIPPIIYNKHFKDGLSKPEFTYWFLKYSAKIYFEDIIFSMENIKNKITSYIAIDEIKAELKQLNDFELRAKELLNNKTIDIYKYYSGFNEFAYEIELIRIRSGYYENHILYDVGAIGNITIILYAKHIYLKEFLENKLKELEPLQSTETKDEQPKPEIIPFTLKQLAFLLLYKGQTITRNNANEIVKQYGHNSGEKLFQLFTKYSSRQNRIGKEVTRKKNLNKIELFEKIIPHLLEQEKQRAIAEMNALKAIFENDYQ